VREGNKSPNSRDKAGKRHWGILKRPPLTAQGERHTISIEKNKNKNEYI